MRIRRRVVDANELVGNLEAAELLGWPRQRVAAYDHDRKAGMPEPIVRLAATPVWLKTDILRWATARGYPLPADRPEPTDTPVRPRRSRATRRP